MKIGITAVLVVAALLACILLLNRPRLLTIDASIPKNFTNTGFSHEVFEHLLLSYVDDKGDIDYARWQQDEPDLQSLDSYLAAVSRFSPESTPDRFRRRSDELAYWLYAYNAYVIKSILDR